MAIHGVDLTSGKVRILVDAAVIDLSASEKAQANTSAGLRGVIAARTGKPLTDGLYYHVVPGGDVYIAIAPREPDWVTFDREIGT